MSEHINCSECGIYWGMPEHYVKKRREDGKTFYCPNGHGQVFRETTLDKVSRERDSLKQQVAQKDDEIRREREQREAVERREKRLKKRASAGTCPCCKRTFFNMATHMHKQHPEFNKSALVCEKAS